MLTTHKLLSPLDLQFTDFYNELFSLSVCLFINIKCKIK